MHVRLAIDAIDYANARVISPNAGSRSSSRCLDTRQFHWRSSVVGRN